MLKKNITYINEFTKEQVTEEHYFHLSKADFVEMQMESLNEPDTFDASGEKLEGFRAKLQRIIDSKDGVAVLAEVKDLLRRSYRKRVGDRPLSGPEIWAEFVGTEAYSQLLFDLCTNAELQADFMNGVMPHELQQDTAKIVAETIALAEKEEVANEAPPTPAPEPKLITRAEMIEMDNDELTSGLATGRYKLS